MKIQDTAVKTEVAEYCNMKSEKLSSAVAQEILT
jgi:hypothetical protein